MLNLPTSNVDPDVSVVPFKTQMLYLGVIVELVVYLTTVISSSFRLLPAIYQPLYRCLL